MEKRTSGLKRSQEALSAPGNEQSRGMERKGEAKKMEMKKRAKKRKTEKKREKERERKKEKLGKKKEKKKRRKRNWTRLLTGARCPNWKREDKVDSTQWMTWRMTAKKIKS